MASIIEAKGIQKSFGALNVLKGIDFTAEKSEVVAIMGASGAGKSTLLQILGTLSTPDAGSLNIDGTDVLHLGSKELSAFRNRRIGFVFQFHHLLPEFTAMENVMIPAFIAHRSDKDVRENAARLLEDIGLKDRMDHKPAELSGGEQQRVAIARAIAKKPKLLLCDEPTGALDYNTGKQVLKLLQDMCRKTEMTVVIVTHNSALTAMADRVIRVKSGGIESVTTNPDPLPIEQIEW